jgi:ribonuclease HI
MSQKVNKYYVVKIGIKPGIYTTWNECKQNVFGFKGAIYKSFKTYQEAQQYLLSSKLNNTIENKKNVLSKKKITQEDNINTSSVLITNNINEVSLEKFKTFKDNNYENYYIFTDGSNQKSHCSYGVYFGNGNPEPYSISPTFYHFAKLITEGDKTNNIAELKAIQAALEIIINNYQYINKLHRIVIVSDSKYSIKCITEWYIKWNKNNWLNSKKEPVANREIIEDILKKKENIKNLHINIIFKHQLAHTTKPTKYSGLNYYLWLGNYMIDYLVQKKVINK